MNTSPTNENAEHLPTPERNGTAFEPAHVTIEELSSYTHSRITEAAAVVIGALTSPEHTSPEIVRQAWVEYAQVTEAFVDSIEETPENPRARSKAQIAAIINKAYIFEATGKIERYLQELDTAEVYAANEGFDDISATLAAEISDRAEQLPLTAEVLVLKLKGKIDDANREVLRDLIDEGADFEDILGNAYGMILETGDDPDEVLAAIGVTE